MAFKNDMTMMYATHDALRRDLDQIARVTARPQDDPRYILRAALGWELFKSYLVRHHTAEDDPLWPPMSGSRRRLGRHPGDRVARTPRPRGIRRPLPDRLHPQRGAVARVRRGDRKATW